MSTPVAAKSSKDHRAEGAEKARREPARQSAAAADAGPFLSLQRAAGNRAVNQLLQSSAPGALIQRKCASCESGGGTCAGCREEQTLRRKADGSSGAARPAGDVPAAVHVALQSANGRPLDPTTRSLMEARFNHDFSRVRVHHDATAGRAAAAINAAAFTVGNSIWFGQGQYQQQTERGQHLLAHELAHTIQQRGQAPSMQRSLRIGSTNDPAEAAADRAADAVLRRSPVPSLGTSRPVLRRQPLGNNPAPSGAPSAPPPRVTRMDDPNMVEVEFENNIYRVLRRATGAREECEDLETNETTLRAAFERTEAWVQVEWCISGAPSTRVQLRFGADIPAALRRALEATFRGPVPDPAGALRNLDITPFIQVQVNRSEQVGFRGRLDVTTRPGTPEVRGGTLSLGLGTESFSGGIDLGMTAPETRGGPVGVSIVPTIRGTFGRPPRVECTRTRVCRKIPQFEFSCVQHVPEQRVPKQQERFLHFEYATDVVATRDSSTGRRRRAENNRAAAQNEREIPLIQQLLEQGWQVSSIRGFTSPEGRREGPREQQRRRESEFMGNQQLSQNRAAAARQFVEGLCNPNGNSLLAMRRRTCFLPDIPVEGRGELLTADNPRTGRELEGDPLAAQATPRFLASDEEAPRRTPELERQLATSTPRQQGSLIYPLLRRAAITFAKEEVIPERNTQLESCPPAVKKAAEEHFDRRRPRPRPRG